MSDDSECFSSTVKEFNKRISYLETEKDGLEVALKNSLHCLEQVNQDGKTITDTIWLDENTTLFDYMQLAIEAV